jgi:hypothetical protein
LQLNRWLACSLHFRVKKELFHPLPHSPPAHIHTPQLANTQLASREARLSPQLMAKLTQHLLFRHPVAIKQGWVLEGWPRSLSAAMLMTAVSAAGVGSSSSSGGGEVVSKGGRRDSTASLSTKVGA